MKRTIRASLAAVIAFGVATGTNAESLDTCLSGQDLLRVARVLDLDGRIVYARVTAHEDGVITRAAVIAPDGTPLADVFDAAAADWDGNDFAVDGDRICAAVDLPESALDAETLVIVSTGLNYAAHAEEAGGGEVFLFPKPSAPTRPYAPVHAPADVTLLDYEVELAFVLLEDVDPFDPPSREVLFQRSAFFLSNDVSDREAIIRNLTFSGHGTGFAEAKGQPGFMPTGPWLIRGSELARGLEACEASSLGLQLFVDEEPEPRQDATTAMMILDPTELIGRIGTWIEEHGRRSNMTFVRAGEGEVRFYPLAVPEQAPLLPAGSIIQTGTPEGVALNAPSPLGVAMRGAMNLRGPFGQFMIEQKELVAAGDSRYLVPGSTVRAHIDGLGVQRFEIGEAGGHPAPHACDGAQD